MEFWGVEVKAGEPLKVTPELDRIIHLSQAALGESKKEKGNESVPLFLKIDDKKIVLGTLSPEKIPQLSFDLVFEREVELSHNWKSGSVYFCGYQTPLPEEEEDDFSDEDSEDEEPFPLINADNGSVQLQVENAKPSKGKSTDAKPAASAKQKAKPVEPSKEAKPEVDSDDDDSDEDDDEDDSDDEEGDSDEEMSVDSEEENDSDSEDEETPKKPEKGKKRSNDSATKTPVPAKKIKSDTPQKTDGKKGGHTATPHPAKGKAAANGSNAKAQTPKSGGQFACKTCDRSFGSDAALQSHSKAKHGGK